MDMQFSANYPMLGAAYYPEAWPDSELDLDIAMMQQAGIKVVRIGEFAWSKMEPAQGCYDFLWLDEVIERLQNAGIHVILGTPSATPPVWLEELDPEMMMLKENGMTMQHGGRRHCCSNNPTYKHHSAKIAKEMAIRYGRHPNVIGWQIDNEIAAFDGCWCSHCKREFVAYLRKRYGTIEHLNARWNLNLFSQRYAAFEQVPRPLPHTWHSPHLKYEWNQFLAHSHLLFVKIQADILHQYTDRPVGTDMMPVFNQDYEQTNAFLDVIQYNHYDDEYSVVRQLFWFDYMRGLKDRPFWVTETATCWNGSVSTPTSLRPEGFCKMNSWLPIVLGAEANMYWLWRQHWAGHELMHGAVLYASGRPMHIWKEVQETAMEYEKCSAFLTATRVKTSVAMMVSSVSDYLMKEQPVVWEEGAHAWETAYTKRLYKAYAPLRELGVRPDVISSAKDLSRYSVLYTPFMLTLEEGSLQDRIRSWVEGGGIWVAGPMCDIRNDIGAHYIGKETGILEEMTGAKIVYQVPDGQHRIPCKCADGSDFQAESWLQLFEVPADAQVLVTAEGYHSALLGKSVIFKKKVGRGEIVVLGTLPSVEDGKWLFADILRSCGITYPAIKGSVAVAERVGDSTSGYAVTEYGGEEGFVYLNDSFTDLITGSTHAGGIKLAPYQTLILQKNYESK